MTAILGRPDCSYCADALQQRAEQDRQRHRDLVDSYFETPIALADYGERVAATLVAEGAGKAGVRG